MVLTIEGDNEVLDVIRDYVENLKAHELGLVSVYDTRKNGVLSPEKDLKGEKQM